MTLQNVNKFAFICFEYSRVKNGSEEILSQIGDFINHV